MWSFSNANSALSLPSLKFSVALRTKSPGPYLSSSISLHPAPGLSSPLYMQTLQTPPCCLTLGPVGPLAWRALATSPQFDPTLSLCLNTPQSAPNPSPGLCSLLDLHFSSDTHHISCDCFYEKKNFFLIEKLHIRKNKRIFLSHNFNYQLTANLVLSNPPITSLLLYYFKINNTDHFISS